MKKNGPNKKPTALKVLEGNPGKRPLPQNEPKPAPVTKIPEPPSWMYADGKTMWNRLAPQLERLGLLTEADLESFSAACQSWGLYLKCQKYLKAKGLTYKYVNKANAENEVERPQVKIAKNALADYRAFCSEFGLSPASRTRIEIKIDEAEDPMESLLSGVR